MATAALIRSRNYPVTVFSPSIRLPLGNVELHAKGAVQGDFDVYSAHGVADLCSVSNVILVALPAMAHKTACEELSMRVGDEHAVIFNAHLSFVADYLQKLVKSRRAKTRIAAWTSTAATAREDGPQSVHIQSLRKQIDITVLGTGNKAEIIRQSEAITGIAHKQLRTTCEAVLSNTNPILHLGMILGNFTRAEMGEAWCQRRSITPSFARYIESMDRERLTIAAAFGCRLPSITEQYAQDGKVPESLFHVFQRLAGQRSVLGPTSLSTRYISEDIPFGIHVFESLGQQCGVETPNLSAGISIFCSLLGRDLRRENDIPTEIAPFENR